MGWLNDRIVEAQREMQTWPQWMRDSAHMEGVGRMTFIPQEPDLNDPITKLAKDLEDQKSINKDQARTIDSLKRALSAAQDDLETLIKTTRIFNRLDEEAARRRELAK